MGLQPVYPFGAPSVRCAFAPAERALAGRIGALWAAFGGGGGGGGAAFATAWPEYTDSTELVGAPRVGFEGSVGLGLGVKLKGLGCRV